MSRRNNQNNYNGNQYYGGNGQYYNGNNNQYYNQNGQYYNQNGQYYNQNGQYYNQNPQQNNKFGLYNQPQQTNNKKKKPINKDLLIKIGIFAGFALLLILIVLGINSCGKRENNEDVRVVGNEKLGYVYIPSDWVNFKNEEPIKGGYQYTDAAGEYILTIDGLPDSITNLKEYAYAYASAHLENAGITQTKLDKYEAYQVKGHYIGQDLWVLVYFYQGKNNSINYLGIEGPEKDEEIYKILETYKSE